MLPQELHISGCGCTCTAMQSCVMGEELGTVAAEANSVCIMRCCVEEAMGADILVESRCVDYLLGDKSH